MINKTNKVVSMLMAITICSSFIPIQAKAIIPFPNLTWSDTEVFGKRHIGSIVEPIDNIDEEVSFIRSKSSNNSSSYTQDVESTNTTNRLIHLNDIKVLVNDKYTLKSPTELNVKDVSSFDAWLSAGSLNRYPKNGRKDYTINKDTGEHVVIMSHPNGNAISQDAIASSPALPAIDKTSYLSSYFMAAITATTKDDNMTFTLNLYGYSTKDHVYKTTLNLTPVVEYYNSLPDTDESKKNSVQLKYLAEYQSAYGNQLRADKYETQLKLLRAFNSTPLTDPISTSIKTINEVLLDTYKGKEIDMSNSFGVDVPTTKNKLYAQLYIDLLNQSGLIKKASTDTRLTVNYQVPDVFQADTTTTQVSDLLTTISEANKVADKYASSSLPYTESTLESVSFMFDDLVRYNYGRMTGAIEQNIGANAADKLNPLPAGFSEVYPDNSSYKDLVINPSIISVLHQKAKMTTNTTTQHLKTLINMMHMITDYSTAEELSGIVNDNGAFSYPEFNEYKNLITKSDEGKELFPEIKDPDMIKRITSFKSIKAGLSYIGITRADLWSPALQFIWDTAVFTEKEGFPITGDLADYNTESNTEPLQRFFSMSTRKMSRNYLTGVAMSSTFIPMQTNMYDPASIRILRDKTFLRDFHIKYGFHRKALMIDDNMNAAVDLYVSGNKGTSRVATLSDLLYYERDIVLYVDDNFYNTKAISELTNKAYERLSNTEQAGIGEQSAGGFFDNLFSNSIEQVLKTGPANKYDQSTINDAIDYGKDNAWWDLSQLKEKFFANGLLLSGGKDTSQNEIKKTLDMNEYSPKQGYAVVSGVYRHKALANYLNTVATKQPPVFVSSPRLYAVTGITNTEFNTVFNYAMLKNLKHSIGIDYKSSLDMDNPIYIDIYGNIITESGFVVIPAASNATLYTNGKYNPYTVGFMSLYSNGEYIKSKSENMELFLETGDFKLDESKGVWVPKNYVFNEVKINPLSPSVADERLLNVLYDEQVSILNNNGYKFDQRVWLTTEVLRGAPLESIDKEAEGLQGRRDINKYGLYMSYKLDELSDMLLPTSNGNSMISMPNLAFMDGIEYLVLFAFKIMMVLFALYIMYKIYIDAVGGTLGLITLWDCISTVLLFVVCLYSIPSAISLSYNETNKLFLQDEIKYVNLLNYEKRLEGREISAVGVEEPKSQTELYLKLDTIEVPWYSIMQDVMFAPVSSKLSELYDEQLKDNFFYGLDGVEVVNDGVYFSIDNLFDSSTVMYNNYNKYLYQSVDTSPTVSYFIPYYYLLDNLLSSVNIYNRDNGIINVTTKIQSDGSIKTMGMIGDYLLSEAFMTEQQDPLGLYKVYGLSTNLEQEFVEETYEDENIKNSLWYVKEMYKEDVLRSNIDRLYLRMKSYIAQNRDMLGRVTDETFIKTMILDLSIEHNRLFRIPACRSIEVFNIDSRDLIRLSVTDKNSSVTSAAQSFGKFIYEESGELGVILCALLIGVYFITSIVKPALVLFLVLLLTYNMIIKNMLTRSKGKTVEGLLYTLAIMVVINSVYAVMLKLGMSLPNFGMNPTISLIGQIGIQVGYLVLVFWIVSAIFKDVSNFGYNVFHTGVLAVTGGITGAFSSVRDKAVNTPEQQKYIDAAKMNNQHKNSNDVASLRDELDRRDKERDISTEDKAFMEDIFKRDDNK